VAGAVIRVSGEFDDAALKKASAALGKFGMKVESTGKSSGKSFDGLKTKTVALGAAIARIGTDLLYAFGRQATNLIKGSITAASDLNETLSKTKVVFGDASSSIIKFSETAATQFGLTQQQVLDSASTFGIFGKSAGLGGKDLSAFSLKLTGLASDLASFNNTTTDEAITALAAGLRGESEPLRKYGVLLDDASLRQEALALGIVKTTKKALTPQQRVLAAQSMILKQTKLQQGDFARTSGGLANQQRILTAQFENLKAQLGQFLLPVVTKIVTFFTSRFMPSLDGMAAKLKDTLGPAIKALEPLFKGIAKVFKESGDVILAVVGALAAAFAAIQVGALITAIAEAGGAFAFFAGEGTALGAVIAALTGPIGLTVIAIAAIVGVMIYAYRTSESFRDKVNEAFAAVGDAIGSAVRIFNTLAEIIAAFVKPALEGLYALALGIANFFINVFRLAAQGVAFAFGFIADALERNKEPLQALMNFFGRIVEIVGKVLGPLLGFLGNVVGIILKAAFMALGIAIGLTIDIIGAIINVAREFGEALIALKDGAMIVFDAIGGFVGALWDKLVGFKDQLVGLAKTIFSPLLSGFKSIVNSIIGIWNGLDFGFHVTVPDIPGLPHRGESFGVDDIFPDIPYLAKGGIVNSPTLAMIGEAGPEAVVPLSRAGGAGIGGVTVQAGAIQISIGSLDGMGRTDIQAIVDQAFQKSMTQLARDIRTRR